MVELLRTVIVNVLESLESGDGYAVVSLARGSSCIWEFPVASRLDFNPLST